MAIELGELRGILSLQDTFSKGIEGAGSALGKFSESFKAVSGLTAGVAAGIGAAAASIVALGQRGAEVADVADGFDSLSKSAGSSAAVMLGALQTGTLNTISNFELMKLSAGALGTGVIKSAADMGTLAAGAKLLADRTGGDTAQAFDTLTGAMATGRTASLKQLGLFVDGGAAAEAYAQKLGKGVKDLTEHEKATALSQGTLAALRKELEIAGPAAEDFGDFIAQGKTAVANFTDNLAVAVATSPVVMAGLAGIRDAIMGAFGGSQQDTVKMLMGYVNQFAIFLVDAAGVAVKSAQFITNAFTGAKIIFNAVLEALFVGLGTAAGLLATLAEKASALPLVGAGFKAMGESFRGSADLANSLAIGFGEMADKATDSAATQNAVFDTVTGVLGKLKDGMVAADQAGGQLASSADKVTGAVREAGAAVKLTEAQLKAMEDQTRKGVEAMADSAEAIRDKFKELQDELTLANKTGIDKRLAELEIAKTEEIAKWQSVAFQAPAIYDELVAAIGKKYDTLTAQAQGHFATVTMAAQAAGFTTRAEMETSAVKAAELYQRMLASGLFTYGELLAAHNAAASAEMALDTTVTGNKLSGYEAAAARARKFYADLLASGLATEAALAKARGDAAAADAKLDDEILQGKVAMFVMVASSASTILRSLFGKNKTAAIAAATIDTIASVVKTLAAYPWPWNLIPAAAAAAAGYAQIAKIRSTDAGFKMGTPGTAFEDFGRGSMEMLHGREAVVTQGQGASLAEMVGDAIREARGAGPGGGAAGPLVVRLYVDGKELSAHIESQIDGGNIAIAKRAIKDRVS